MGFFSFIVLLAIAYLIWRVTDQLPDLIFRLSEIQRDVAEIRRRLAESSEPGAGSAGTGPRTGAAPAPSAPAAPSTPPTSSPSAPGGGSGSDASGS
jgi:hypothetical protein